MLTAIRRGITVGIRLLAWLCLPPAVLLAIGPAPLPRRGEPSRWVAALTDGPRDPHVVAALVLDVVWAGWTITTLALIVGGLARLVAPVRGRRWPTVRLRPAQALSATLLGATTVTTAGAASPVPPPVVAAADLVTAPPVPDAAVTVPGTALVGAPQTTGNPPTHTVVHGDTLWHIADVYLSDPQRWPEIYQHNADRYDHAGRMRHGDHIEPGWVLVLPDDAAPPATAPPGPPSPPGPAPSTPPSNEAAPSPTPSTPASTAPQPSTATPGAGHQDKAAPPSSSDAAAHGSPTSAPSTPNPATAHSRGAQPEQPHGISLPGGSWIDLGLATGIAAAASLVWAHRRHRYTRRPPSPKLRLDTPEVAPLPPVVNQIRRQLRHLSGHTADPTRLDPQDPGRDTGPHATTVDHRWTPVDGDEPDAGLDLLDQPGDTRHDTGQSADTDEDKVHDPASAPGRDRGDDTHLPYPVVPKPAHPRSVPWPPAGLGLTGTGAQAAARGLLATALTDGGLDRPDDRSEVVMAAATAATLLGADAVTVPQTPRLTIAADLDTALDLLETQALHRSRLVDAHDVDTVAQLRAADPTGEPLVPMLLLADATTRHHRTRIAALLAQGQRLDIHGVLLGAWPDGDTVVVAADGTTRRTDADGARHGGHPADIGRLAVLTPAETSDLLRTLAESHTGTPPAPAPIDLATTSTTTATSGAPTAPPDDPLPGHAPTADAAPAQAVTATAPATASGNGNGGDQPAATPPTVADTTGDDHHPDDRHAADGAPDSDGPATGTTSGVVGAGRVEVSVLGPAGILDVPPGPTLRKKSLELLVYLAVRDGQASAEAILDDLMPDVPTSKAPGRLYTYVSDLRTVLRRTGGPGAYLTHPDRRYALNHDTVEVDLWRMRAAIRHAQRATDPAERLAVLRCAVDTYAGPLAESADYEWIEPYREAVGQQALDAHLALADALADNPAEQIAVLDAAIRHHPHVEDLYRQAMRARAALGHLDAIRTLRRAVTRALGEIDAEPTDDTIALADQLVAGLQRPGRPGMRPAPRPATTRDGAAA